MTDASVFSLLSPILPYRLCYFIIRGQRRGKQNMTAGIWRGEYKVLCPIVISYCFQPQLSPVTIRSAPSFLGTGHYLSPGGGSEDFELTR